MNEIARYLAMKIGPFAFDALGEIAEYGAKAKAVARVLKGTSFALEAGFEIIPELIHGHHLEALRDTLAAGLGTAAEGAVLAGCEGASDGAATPLCFLAAQAAGTATSEAVKHPGAVAHFVLAHPQLLAIPISPLPALASVLPHPHIDLPDLPHIPTPHLPHIDAPDLPDVDLPDLNPF